MVLNVTKTLQRCSPGNWERGTKWKTPAANLPLGCPSCGEGAIKSNFYGVILFMGLVDLNRALIITQIINWYSCYDIQDL